MICKMKKLMTLVLVICICIISGNAFGQEKEKQNERKGGIAVGGFDNTRQDKAVKRSIEVSEQEAVPVEKAAEAMPAEPAAATVPPAEEAKDNKEQIGQARSHDAKKNSKSKGKHKK